MSYLTIPALVGPMVGPPLGGFITTYFDWRWIFLINLPMGLVGIALGRRLSPMCASRHRRWTGGVLPIPGLVWA